MQNDTPFSLPKSALPLGEDIFFTSNLLKNIYFNKKFIFFKKKY